MQALIALLVLLSITEPAFAYLDPGSGSMLLQGILATVAVAGAAISGYWSKIRGFASGLFRRRRTP